jgi:hypothetical protein
MMTRGGQDKADVLAGAGCKVICCDPVVTFPSGRRALGW